MAASSFNPTREMIDAVHIWRERQASQQVARSIVPVLREQFGVNSHDAITIVRAAVNDDPREELKARIKGKLMGAGGIHDAS